MAATSLQSLGYLPVATAALNPAAVLDYDLFIQRPGAAFLELYLGHTYPLEEADLARLRADGVDHLYIRSDDADAFRRYLCDHVLSSPDVPAPQRVQALREVTRVALEDALAASDCTEAVRVAGSFGRDLAGVMAERSIRFGELFTTLEHDYYTFTHVCNVSVYCTALACRLGISDAAQLAELAAGALLHDIGKRHIPAHVLNKPGKLDDGQWKLIEQHPTTGFRELMNRSDVTWAQLMMVYQHHERLNGTGYPTGVGADETHFWARICSVADVFDALTCRRPYRNAISARQACEYLEKHAGAWFDPEVVAAWTRHVRGQP